MKLILYGAGFWGEHALSFLRAENVDCFCDSKTKGDEEGELRGKKIISFQKLMEIYKENEYVVVVCAGNNFTEEISKQLDEVGISDYLAYDVLCEIVEDFSVFIKQLQVPLERERLFRKYYKFLATRVKSQFDYLKSHVDIMTLKPARGTLREKQLGLVDFAVEFFDFIKELEIKPFLNFGNLIGAFRHQGFVPWDDDLDFGLMRYEVEKLMDFAEKNCIVGTLCNGVWAEKSGIHMKLEELFQKYSDSYIFSVCSDMIQIYKRGNNTKVQRIDIWIYDFYDEEYELAEHEKWIHSIEKKVCLFENETEKVEFLKRERLKNPMISMKETKYFYPGIDNWGGYPGVRKMENWILTEDIFPLKKVKYENAEFWAPKDMEALLKYEYSSYMDFPYDVGRPIHGTLDED